MEHMDDTECFLVEINIRKRKWLIVCSYNPHRNTISEHLHSLSKRIDLHSSRYDNLLIIGDFNVESTDKCMGEFCESYSLKHLVKVPTCFKNPNNPSCIDLMLTNKPMCFQNTVTLETGLSDFHKMTLTVMKYYFKKQEPKIVNYRDYKKFSNDIFQQEVLSELQHRKVDSSDLENYTNIFMKVLNRQAPIKQKYLRANQAPYMNKTLQKAVMQRTKLRNTFLKNRTTENKTNYNKQRNLCVSLFRKEKKRFYSNIDTKDISDNKRFWKTVKPFLSKNTSLNEKITLVENEEIISDEGKIADIFNTFFSNIVTNLNIVNNEHLYANVEHGDPVSNAINKYSNHPSILAIKAQGFKQNSFSLTKVLRSEISREIMDLNPKKASQKNDIPTKIIKDNADIICEVLWENFNLSMEKSKFPQPLKKADITPIFKKDSRLDKSNYRPVSILPNLSKIFERCIYNQISLYFLMTYYQSINAASGKVLTRSTVLWS